MELREALGIVLDLAADNVLDERDAMNDKEKEEARKAVEVVGDFIRDRIGDNLKLTCPSCNEDVPCKDFFFVQEDIVEGKFECKCGHSFDATLTIEMDDE